MVRFEAVRSGALRKAAPFGISALAVALSACGTAAVPFEPVHASGSAATYSAAAYDLKVGPLALGKATVWSQGATDNRSTGGRVVDVQIDIDNTSQAPIRLDVAQSGVTVTTRDGRSVPLGAPVKVGGSRTVEPVSSGRVGLHYALPNGLAGRDLAKFEFNWHVASSFGDYQQSTAFVPMPPPASDALNDRGLICNGMYRISSIGECASDTPTTTLPIR